VKKLVLAVCAVFSILTGAGCLVTSVYPYYSDDTVVFDPALLGTWVGDEGRTTWTFTKDGDKAYRVVVEEEKSSGPSHPGAAKLRSVLLAHVFRMGSVSYLDAFPKEGPQGAGDSSWASLMVETHFLAKIDVSGESLKVRALDLDAVRRALQGPSKRLAAVARQDDGGVGPVSTATGTNPILLTAPTSQLQAFLREQADAVFERDGGLMKKR
jgi:hypothetical protein